MHSIPPGGRVLRPARWDGDGAALSQVDRCMALAFFPGRAPRSEAYLEGCRAALEYRYLGKKMPLGYPQGTSEADAWNAGIAEGHSIWRAGGPATGEQAATPDEEQLLMAWRTMNGAAQRMVGGLALNLSVQCPRHSAPSLHVLSSGAPAEGAR